MKELNLIEKADAYDRVTKEVKDFFEGKQKLPFDVDKTLEYLFPELKESEDEKIREWLIGYFNQYITDGMPVVFGNGLNVRDIIAWLEKQDEQKPAWNEEDEREKKRIIGLLEGWMSTFKETNYAEDCKLGITWLESFKDRFLSMNRSMESDNIAKPNINVKGI